MITASIVTYHTPLPEIDKVLSCLAVSEVEKVYVIDNSRDKAMSDHLSGNPFVEYIASDNVGYGGAHNQGIRRAMTAGAEFHIVLNSDVYWSDPVVETCRDYMTAHQDVGQVMPKVFYPDGRLQYQCKLLPTPLDLLFRRLLPSGMLRRRERRYQLEFTGYDHEMNVPYLSGCFMFFRMSALREVGIFDERFFMYPEDIDMTRRIHTRYRTMYLPAVSITHIYAVQSRKNARMFMIHARNMIKYFNKWGWILDSGRRRYYRRLLAAEAEIARRR